MFLGSDVPSMILPKLTFGDWAKKETDGRTAFDWLSRDHGEVDKYVADPLCGWNASVSMWQDIFKLVFTGADDASFCQGSQIAARSICMAARMTPQRISARRCRIWPARMRKMGFADVTLDINPDDRHECLNDLNRDAVTASLVDWLSQIRR